jgi:hypothetical protein
MKSEKELKKQIRELRKLKNQMRPGSVERVELHRKIKELKTNLISMKEVNKEKQPLIDKILTVNPLAKYIDLDKYTKKETIRITITMLLNIISMTDDARDMIAEQLFNESLLSNNTNEQKEQET